MPRTNLESTEWPTLPVDQIVGPATFAAIQKISSAKACVLQRPVSWKIHAASSEKLTEFRDLSPTHCQQMRDLLANPKSYWIGHPIYRRNPPRYDFLVECGTRGGSHLTVQFDLSNPGWQIECASEKYRAFMFNSHVIRAIAKELFAEFASQHKSSMWAKGAFSKPVSDATTSSAE